MRRASERRRRLAAAACALLPAALLTSCGGSSTTTIYSGNSVVIADFNGDGSPDIAVATAVVNNLDLTEKPGQIGVLLANKGSPGKFAAVVHYSTEGNPSAMAAGDLNGSGSPGLVVANFNKGTLSVLLQTAPNSGSFQSAMSVPLGFAPGAVAGQTLNLSNPSDVAIADVDGDGLNDLVVADGNSGYGGGLIIVRQTSPGVFGTKVEYPSPVFTGYNLATLIANTGRPNTAVGVAVGNLNGDGHSQDAVITSYDANGLNGTVSVFFHDPANPGSFLAQRLDIPLPCYLHRVKIADVNMDGFPDIITECVSTSGDSVSQTFGVVVILQNAASPGTFATPVTYLGSAMTAIQPPISLAVADVNGDGYPDIVTTSGSPAGTGTVQVLLNTPATPGVFDVTSLDTLSLAGVGNPISVAVGELNGDQYPDIATADTIGTGVYFQTASHTFNAATLIGG